MKNDYEIRGNVTAIIIDSPKYGRKEALVSTDKLELVQRFANSWRLNWSERGKTFYVMGYMPRESGFRKNIHLHRWVLDTPDGMQVDHRNHNGLDNTDENLRIATQCENMQNKKGAHLNSQSGVRGVCWNKKHGKWVAHIRVKGKQIYLGCFTDVDEARRATVEARIKYMPFSQEALAK